MKVSMGLDVVPYLLFTHIAEPEVQGLAEAVSISSSVFGDYAVVLVEYPGLPSSPPSLSELSIGAGPTSSRGINQQPLTADDGDTSKSQKLSTWIIAVITVSSCFPVLVSIGVVIFVLRWRNLRQLGRGSVGFATTMPTTKRSGD